MVEISDQSCAVLGSRAQRSWPRFKNFPIMCNNQELFSAIFFSRGFVIRQNVDKGKQQQTVVPVLTEQKQVSMI